MRVFSQSIVQAVICIPLMLACANEYFSLRGETPRIQFSTKVKYIASDYQKRHFFNIGISFLVGDTGTMEYSHYDRLVESDLRGISVLKISSFKSFLEHICNFLIKLKCNVYFPEKLYCQ